MILTEGSNPAVGLLSDWHDQTQGSWLFCIFSNIIADFLYSSSISTDLSKKGWHGIHTLYVADENPCVYKGNCESQFCYHYVDPKISIPLKDMYVMFFFAGNVTWAYLTFTLWTCQTAWIYLKNAMLGITWRFRGTFKNSLMFTSHTLRFLICSMLTLWSWGLHFIWYFSIVLSYFWDPASFLQPLRQHVTPPVKRPFMITTPLFPLMAKLCKGLPQFDSQYKSLVISDRSG